MKDPEEGNTKECEHAILKEVFVMSIELAEGYKRRDLLIRKAEDGSYFLVCSECYERISLDQFNDFKFWFGPF